jgi:hypothetical protein
MSNGKQVKIVAGALDEVEGSPMGIILRGVVDAVSLHHLLKDDYQREAQPLSSQWRILDALQKGEPLPDIELGMRGENFTSREECFLLKDDVYIIDGLQRVTTAIHFLGTNPGAAPRLGATVHFNTTKEWERKRFHTLNTHRLKVSPNVLLRNMREESPAVFGLYGLTVNDKSFVLNSRVSWTQRMTKGELLTALTFAKTVGLLHSHKVAGKGSSIEQLVPALNKAVEVFGIQALRENVRTFFNLVDECWGIKSVQYREGAIYMRGMFLYVLALLLADHHDFWPGDEKRLLVNVDLKRKIAQFPIHDPEVVRLSGASGTARVMLYTLLRDHINSGKRTKRLKPRQVEVTPDLGEDEEAAA